MKKQILSILLFVVVSLFANSQVQADNKNKQILGEWLYEVSEAPYGYEKGSLIFTETNGKITGVVKLEAGELPINDLKIEKDSVIFTTMVDGSNINVALKFEKNKLVGKVDSPEGPKTLTAIKK